MTLVLLHPVGLDRHSWQFMRRHIPEDAVSYDLLWHGGRPEPDTRLSMESFADDLVRHTTGALDLVGVSMGGAVAQTVALRHPGRVRSLLLAASGPGGGNGQAQRDRAAAVLSDGVDGVLDSTMERWFTRSALDDRHDPAIEYSRAAIARNGRRSFAAAWNALAEHDVAKDLHTVSAPATVVHPLQDAAGNEDDRRRMAELIPTSRFIVTDGPHMLQMERPDDFASIMFDHLEWVGATGKR